MTAEELQAFVTECAPLFDRNRIVEIDANAVPPGGWQFVDRGDGVFVLKETVNGEENA